jgi:hypothetical protein
MQSADPFAEMVQRPELLLPILEKEPDCAKFEAAMQIAFDVPAAVMADVVAYDLLQCPTLRKPSGRLNYYTLASELTSERVPILSVLSYLFDACDPCYQEAYVRTPEEMERLEECRQRLRARYPTPSDYFEAVAKRLYLADHNLAGGLGGPRRKQVALAWGLPAFV